MNIPLRAIFILAFAIAFAQTGCSGCSRHSAQSLEPTMKLWVFMLPSYLEDPQGRFPHNSLGYEYALYDMGLSKITSGEELYSEQRMKGSIVPFKYDHPERKVYETRIHFLNTPDLYFEPDPEKAVVVFVASENKPAPRGFLISNDLCLYAVEGADVVSAEGVSNFLGLPLKEVHETNQLVLLSDVKYARLKLLPNDNCRNYSEAWFCDSIATWQDVWERHWEFQGYNEDWQAQVSAPVQK